MLESSLILGEFRRSIDERYRVSIPTELLEALLNDQDAVLVKERPGCCSLWQHKAWQEQLTSNLQVIESKIKANRMDARLPDLQKFGRLLSTRHRDIQIAGRGRILIPEGFREFLMAEPGTDLLIVGAAVCIEIWNIDAWRNCLNEQIPDFSGLLEELAQ